MLVAQNLALGVLVAYYLLAGSPGEAEGFEFGIGVFSVVYFGPANLLGLAIVVGILAGNRVAAVVSPAFAVLTSVVGAFALWRLRSPLIRLGILTEAVCAAYYLVYFFWRRRALSTDEGAVHVKTQA